MAGEARATKAIIFDCFGVLVGTGFWNVYHSLGGDPVKDAEFIDQMLDKANLGIITQAELREAMAMHLGVSIDEYAAAFAADERPDPQIFDFIRSELKPNYKLAVLSNASHGLLERKIPPDLLGLFDVVVASGDVGIIKPDPAIYRLTIDRLGVMPEQTVFIDDNTPYVRAAQAVGIHAILYKDFVEFKQQLRNLIEVA